MLTTISATTTTTQTVKREIKQAAQRADDQLEGMQTMRGIRPR